MRSFITSAQTLEWASAGLVFIVAMLMGTYAAQGMNGLQWAGAAAAVLGSVTLAVLVRIWPAGKTLAEVLKD